MSQLGPMITTLRQIAQSMGTARVLQDPQKGNAPPQLTHHGNHNDISTVASLLCFLFLFWLRFFLSLRSLFFHFILMLSFFTSQWAIYLYIPITLLLDECSLYDKQNEKSE
jgi:hypothetical protein